jgi:hypothetical protein
MDTALVSGITGFATAVLGTLLSHRLLQERSHKEFAERYRNRLFDKQLAAYEALWKTLRRTSAYFTEETVFVYDQGQVVFSQANATKLAIELTDFFFTEHGLYLSKSTRNALFDARRALTRATVKHGEAAPAEVMPKADCNAIGAALKELVHATRRDIGLRALRFKAQEIGIPDDQIDR